MTSITSVFPSQLTAKFSILSHKEYTLVITGHLFKTSPIQDWLTFANTELSHPLLQGLLVSTTKNASHLAVNLKGELSDAESFVWYIAGKFLFMPSFDYSQVNQTELTPHAAATLYRAIASCCENYKVLPEEVMQDPSMSGDLLHFFKDAGYNDDISKTVLATAGYYFVQ